MNLVTPRTPHVAMGARLRLCLWGAIELAALWRARLRQRFARSHLARPRRGEG